MKKKIIFYLISLIVVCCIGICMILNHSELKMDYVKISSCEENHILQTTREEQIVGRFTGLNSKQSGLYLIQHDDKLQLFFKLPDSTDETDQLVYTSDRNVSAYCTYSLDNSMLLLEMFWDENEKMKFSLKKIGHGDSYNEIINIYSDECNRMPYVAITEISSQNVLDSKKERILLNYDNGNGYSHLLMLGPDYGKGIEPIVVASSYFSCDDNGVDTGRRIVFAGGYDKYVFYQTIDSIVTDPSEKKVTFETCGRPNVFRYDISNELTEKIGPLDRIVLHLNASEDYMLVSEYSYDTPLENSGKILSLNRKKDKYIIPGIESGTDIIQSKYIDENSLVFYTATSLYIVDMGERKIYTRALHDNNRVFLSGEAVIICQTNESDEVNISWINYSDVLK